MLSIRDESALREAWKHLNQHMDAHYPKVSRDGILVEAMEKIETEMFIGARRDPLWGPLLTVGLGGIWVEALSDVRVLAADLAPESIAGEVRKLKGAKLLSGLRGRAPVDVDAIAMACSQLGTLLIAHPEILEVDLNPVVTVPGRGAVVLDVAIIVGQAA
jgi:acyl-CoA synthetase (NDP forming)